MNPWSESWKNGSKYPGLQKRLGQRLTVDLPNEFPVNVTRRLTGNHFCTTNQHDAKFYQVYFLCHLLCRKIDSNRGSPFHPVTQSSLHQHRRLAYSRTELILGQEQQGLKR